MIHSREQTTQHYIIPLPSNIPPPSISLQQLIIQSLIFCTKLAIIFAVRERRGRGGEVDDDEAAVCVGGISMQVVLEAITVLVVTATSAGKISGPHPHNRTNQPTPSGYQHQPCLGKNLSQESWPLIETLIGFYKRTLSTELTGGEGRDSDLACSWNILLLLANTTFRENSRFPLGFNNLIMSMENTLGLISGVKKKYYVN